MKLQKLQLHPFAGTADRSISFTNGLNVIVGPNEAGKSTLLQALRCLFFMPSGLTAHQFTRQMEKFLPLQGGDTIRVEGDIELDGEAFTLTKSWGGTKASRLVLPSGTDLTEAAKVEAEIARRLGFSQAVYDQVLLTRQNQLAATIELLRREKESTLSLSDKLRQYDLEGVSVQNLKAEIDRETEEYFNNWDRERSLPKDGKSHKNPWKNKVGQVLRAWYDLKALEENLEKTQRLENRLDTLNAQLSNKGALLALAQAYVEKHAPLVADVQKRNELTLRLSGLKKDKEIYGQVADQWPVQQNKLQECRQRKESIEAQLNPTEALLKSLKEYNKKLEDVKLYEQASLLAKEYELLKQELEQVQKVTKADIDLLRKAERDTDRLRNMIDAQKLRIAIMPKKDIIFKIKRGANPQDEVQLDGSELYQVEAGSRVQIEHEDFSIVVASGDTDVKKLMKDIQESEARFQDLLSQWGIASIDELEGKKSLYDQKEFELSQKAQQVRQSLNGRKYNELEESIKAIQKPDTSESQDVLEERLRRLGAELSELNPDIRNANTQVQEWERKYGSREALFDKLLELTGQFAAMDKELNSLKALPDEIQDANEFLNQFAMQKAKAETLKDEKHRLELERQTLLKEAKETSSEELLEQVSFAAQVFEKNLRTGKAYLRVQEELDTILEELDRDTFTPLKKKTEEYFHKLTAGKYHSLGMDELVPSTVQIDSKTLPAELLSTGTLDLLALATRLAMADFYLPENDGFIILDDPLVNLDPERQVAAAQCLKEIAMQRQVIILTCHPSHVALLEGDVIEL